MYNMWQKEWFRHSMIPYCDESIQRHEHIVTDDHISTSGGIFGSIFRCPLSLSPYIWLVYVEHIGGETAHTYLWTYIVKSNNGSKETSHTIKSRCACVWHIVECNGCWQMDMEWVYGDGEILILLLLLENLPTFIGSFWQSLGCSSFSLFFFYFLLFSLYFLFFFSLLGPLSSSLPFILERTQTSFG